MLLSAFGLDDTSCRLSGWLARSGPESSSFALIDAPFTPVAVSFRRSLLVVTET